jgi:hypothetical protein
VVPSKGKRRKKRKLEEQGKNDDDTESLQLSPPQMPAIFDHLTIGFNSTVRSLEAMSKQSRPAALKNAEQDIQQPAIGSSNLAAVFVCRATLPDPVTVSIPLLVATASLSPPEQPPIRLVQLPAIIETQLAKALHQPRVGFVGLRSDMPSADVLLALVRAAVSPVHVPWLDCSETPQYLPVQIESTETSVGLKEKPNQSSSTPKTSQLKGKLPKEATSNGKPLRGKASEQKPPEEKPPGKVAY